MEKQLVKLVDECNNSYKEKLRKFCCRYCNSKITRIDNFKVHLRQNHCEELDIQLLKMEKKSQTTKTTKITKHIQVAQKVDLSQMIFSGKYSSRGNPMVTCVLKTRSDFETTKQASLQQSIAHVQNESMNTQRNATESAPKLPTLPPDGQFHIYEDAGQNEENVHNVDSKKDISIAPRLNQTATVQQPVSEISQTATVSSNWSSKTLTNSQDCSLLRVNVIQTIAEQQDLTLTTPSTQPIEPAHVKPAFQICREDTGFTLPVINFNEDRTEKMPNFFSVNQTNAQPLIEQSKSGLVLQDEEKENDKSNKIKSFIENKITATVNESKGNIDAEFFAIINSPQKPTIQEEEEKPSASPDVETSFAKEPAEMETRNTECNKSMPSKSKPRISDEFYAMIKSPVTKKNATLPPPILIVDTPPSPAVTPMKRETTISDRKTTLCNYDSEKRWKQLAKKQYVRKNPIKYSSISKTENITDENTPGKFILKHFSKG